MIAVPLTEQGLQAVRMRVHELLKNHDTIRIVSCDINAHPTTATVQCWNVDEWFDRVQGTEFVWISLYDNIRELETFNGGME